MYTYRSQSSCDRWEKALVAQINSEDTESDLSSAIMFLVVNVFKKYRRPRQQLSFFEGVEFMANAENRLALQWIFDSGWTAQMAYNHPDFLKCHSTSIESIDLEKNFKAQVIGIADIAL